MPAAYVELVAGRTATEEELIAFLHGAIASFKSRATSASSRRVADVGEQIQKFRLREQLLDELGIADPALEAVGA